MNLTREQAMAALEALVGAGFHAEMHVHPNPDRRRGGGTIINHDGPLYRIALTGLTFEDTDLRELCDLAESVGLQCRYTLGAIRFEAPQPEQPQAHRVGGPI